MRQLQICLIPGEEGIEVTRVETLKTKGQDYYYYCLSIQGPPVVALKRWIIEYTGEGETQKHPHCTTYFKRSRGPDEQYEKEFLKQGDIKMLM